MKEWRFLILLVNLNVPFQELDRMYEKNLILFLQIETDWIKGGLETTKIYTERAQSDRRERFEKLKAIKNTFLTARYNVIDFTGCYSVTIPL